MNRAKLNNLFPYAGNAFVKPRWGFNFEEFKRRFDPETTNGEGRFLLLLVDFKDCI